jgi:hypothetical protein
MRRDIVGCQVFVNGGNNYVPSPTAEVMLFTDPGRTAPTANTPGRAVQ